MSLCVLRTLAWLTVAGIAPTAVIAAIPPEAKWTIMVYMNARNTLSEYAIGNLAQMAEAVTSSDVNVVVEWGDKRWHSNDVLRFRLKSDMAFPPAGSGVTTVKNVNMGDPQTLEDFVIWARANYPAERSMLIIWSHGSGYRYETGQRIRDLEEVVRNHPTNSVAAENAVYLKNLLRRAQNARRDIERAAQQEIQILASSNIPQRSAFTASTNANSGTAEPRRAREAVRHGPAIAPATASLPSATAASRVGASAPPGPSRSNLIDTISAADLDAMRGDTTATTRWIKNLGHRTETDMFRNDPRFLTLMNPMTAAGSDVRAVSLDESDSLGRRLYNSDVAAVIRRNQVDLIGFDACLMAMVETAFAMKAGAKFMVASEENIPGEGWNYREWLKRLVATPTMTPSELGKQIVDSYEAKYPGDESAKLTLSSTDLLQIDRLSLDLSGLAAKLITALAVAEARGAISAAVRYCPAYGGAKNLPGYGSMPNFNYVDLHCFLDQLRGQLNKLPEPTRQSEVVASILPAIDAVDQTLLGASYPWAGTEYRSAGWGSKGLSIYLPTTKQFYQLDRLDSDFGYKRGLTEDKHPVAFVDYPSPSPPGVGWVDFLQAYFAVASN